MTSCKWAPTKRFCPIIALAFLFLLLLPPDCIHAQEHRWKVGDKVDVETGVATGKFRPATISATSTNYYRLHYDDNNTDSGIWVLSSFIRARNAALKPEQRANTDMVYDWNVGDKVEVLAGAGEYRPAVVTAASDKEIYFRLHYEDNNTDSSTWVSGTSIRARGTQQRYDAAAKLGPRTGKYWILGYPGLTPVFNGYFTIKPSGAYEVFNMGGRSLGSGIYSFDTTATTVKWKTGPFSDPGWDGTQKFEVSREGKTHIIRLKRRTIGSNSTDSQ